MEGDDQNGGIFFGDMANQGQTKIKAMNAGMKRDMENYKKKIQQLYKKL